MKLNRFALLYLSIVAFAFISVREVLHSSQFAGFVSKKITTWLAQGVGGEVSIEQIRLELFPFGMTLNNAEFKSPDIELSIDRMGVTYGLLNAFKSDIVIEEVKLTEGNLKIISNKSNEETKSLSVKEVSALWEKNYKVITDSSFRIENVILNRFKIESQNINLEIPNASISVNEEISLEATIESLDTNTKDIKQALPDSVELIASANSEKLLLKRLDVYKGLAKLEAQGELQLDEDINFNEVGVKISGPDQAFTKWFPRFSEIDPSFEGYLNTQIIINGNLKSPLVNVNATVSYLKSRYLNAQKIELSASLDKDIVKLEKVRVSEDTGYADITLSNPVNVKNERLLKEGLKDVTIELNNLSSKTMFHFLEGTLDPLEGQFTGILEADVTESGIKIKSIENLKINDFRLQLSDGEPLLKHRSFRLYSIDLDLKFSPFNLDLKSNFATENTQASLVASLDEQGIRAKVGSDKFALGDFEKIQGVPISGSGKLNIDVVGPWDNIKFDFNGDLAQASVAGYDLGRIEIQGILPLKGEYLYFSKLQGRKGFSRYEGEVRLDLGSRPYPLKINFDAKRANLNDLTEILAPITPDILKERTDIQARFKTKGQVQVDFSERPVKLDISVDGESLAIAGEYFDSFKSNVKMDAGRLNIYDFQIEREATKGTGQLLWDTDSSYMEYEFSMSGMSLSSFNVYRLSPLSLEGNLSFDLYGSGLLNDDHSLRATLTLQDSMIKRSRVANSKLDAYYTKGEWTFQGELLEGVGRLEAFLPIGSPKKRALVRLDLTTSEIGPLVGLLSPARMNDESLKGRIASQIQASFPVEHPENADVQVDIRRIELEYKNKHLKLNQGKPLAVKKGSFLEWNLVSKEDSDLRLSASAKGKFKDNFSLDASYNIPAEFFELLSDRLIDMTGRLEGRMNFGWGDSGVSSFLNHNARDVQFRLKDVPGRFSNIIFDASLDNDEVILQNFSGNYGRGTFNITGKGSIKIPHPSVNLKMTLNDISYPLFNRSNINFDSRFSLVGTRPPYLFAGQVVLQQVNLVEDVGTYLGQMSGGTSYERFIPNTTQSVMNQYIEVDIGVRSNNAIRVSNPLMEMVLDANLKLTGELMTPLIDGRVSGVPGRSKIAFKGHEFALTKSTVDFDPATGPSKAILDLTGRTSVSGYNINLLVNGAVDQMNIVLNSEPALPQDEIVSLLTLGITSDISKNLNEQDRRSITTMSLGGFLFDQLQLTRGLDSNLGLKVSLAPEFSSDEGNLIEEVSSDTSSSRRLKTGTKLRVQSQLGKKTSVSFSSTLGGEVEQKQEMNVNYDFNRAWSLEGVYELKSSVEENQGDTQSLGADVKYRWSF